jgi:POLQ-like helicase
MIVDQCEVKTAPKWPYERFKVFENELRTASSQWYSARRFPTHPKMPYCLKAHDRWPQNIICNDVAEYIKKEYKKHHGKDYFTLHKFIQHGLSSQAMVFNLVGPLIVRKDYEPLRQVFDEAGIQWPHGNIDAEFEYDDRKVFNENVGQPTSIDLRISGEDTGLFIEAKLAEKEFGSCSIFRGGDCEGMNPCKDDFSTCYLHHIGRRYWQKLKEYDFIDGAFESSPICPLASYYQFFREILFAISKGGKFILLDDERSPVFVRKSDNAEPDRGLWPFLMQFVPERYRGHLARITIKQVTKAIEDSGRHNDWIDDFKSKYGINNHII